MIMCLPPLIPTPFVTLGVISESEHERWRDRDVVAAVAHRDPSHDHGVDRMYDIANLYGL